MRRSRGAARPAAAPRSPAWRPQLRTAGLTPGRPPPDHTSSTSTSPASARTFLRAARMATTAQTAYVQRPRRVQRAAAATTSRAGLPLPWHGRQPQGGSRHHRQSSGHGAAVWPPRVERASAGGRLAAPPASTAPSAAAAPATSAAGVEPARKPHPPHAPASRRLGTVAGLRNLPEAEQPALLMHNGPLRCCSCELRKRQAHLQRRGEAQAAASRSSQSHLARQAAAAPPPLPPNSPGRSRSRSAQTRPPVRSRQRPAPQPMHCHLPTALDATPPR
mmetsp:Transcript_63947/g.165032  ORF Transcript_63947/g.165032 Transcript_63947/m.165032 type:complete len:276 (+) Transcript_63947:1244-2071(+)